MVAAAGGHVPRLYRVALMATAKRQTLSNPHRAERHPCPRCEAAFQHAGGVLEAFMNDQAGRGELAEAFAVLKVALDTRRPALGPAPVRPSPRAYRMQKR
jgi:hypothetical protein